MARKETVTVTDDIDGAEDAQTVLFSYEGKNYSIDLASKNKAKLDKALAPYIQAGTKVSQARSLARRGAHGLSEDVAVIRSWARDQGMEVSERGRVSQKVRDAFNSAH